MKVIFGTTNERKVKDLQNVSTNLCLNLEILSLNDIGWDLGEIEETGNSLEENSLIKASAISNFCHIHNINYPIITDDAGLFCEVLNGKPGIYTGRYGDEDLKNNPNLPKYQGVLKLLEELKNEENRKAYYQCVVTCMFFDKNYYQETAKTYGTIAKEVLTEPKKPYFYSVFVMDGTDKAFQELKEEELSNTYRYKALKKTLTRLNNYNK